MKVLIVSDSHRYNEHLKTVLSKTRPIDLFIHLGDFERTEDTVRRMVTCPSQMVAGNNDYYSDLNREQTVHIGKYKAFLTHGHAYYVTVGMERLVEAGKERGCDIVMYGHTHRPVIDIREDIVILNPGSISYPRQEGRVPSYIIMEIDQNEEAHYTLNYVDNILSKSWRFLSDKLGDV